MYLWNTGRDPYSPKTMEEWRRTLRLAVKVVNQLDARTLLWLRRQRATVVDYLLSVLAVVVEASRSTWSTHVYLRETRAENRRRDVVRHRYRAIDVTYRYTVYAIRMAAQAEAMGSTRYAAGLTT